MSRSRSLILLLTAAVLTAGAVARAGAATGHPAVSPRVARACVHALMPAPRAIPGSAASSELDHFPALQHTPITAALPRIAQAVRIPGVVSYDPAHVVHLTNIIRERIYAVPVTIETPAIPSACAAVSRVPGFVDFTRQALSGGTGPGICIVSPRGGLGQCEAYPAMTTYLGASGGTAAVGLVPAGVRSATYDFVGLAPQTVPASGGIVASPLTAAVSGARASQISIPGVLAQILPLRVTLHGSASVTYRRPGTLVPLLSGVIRFVSKLPTPLADRLLGTTTVTKARVPHVASVSG